MPAGMSRGSLDEAQRKAADQVEAAESGAATVVRRELSAGEKGQVAQLLEAMVQRVAMAEVGLGGTMAMEAHHAACFAAEAARKRSGKGKGKGFACKSSSARGVKQLQEQQQRQSARLSAPRRVDGAVSSERPDMICEQVWPSI
jgi:hypothetical protein